MLTLSVRAETIRIASWIFMCFFSCRYLLLLLKIAQNDLSPLLHSTTPAVFACIACSPPQIAGLFFFRCTVTTCSAGCLLFFFATSFLDNSFIFPIKHSTSRRRLSSGSSSRSRETRLFFCCCCCCWCFYMLCASNRGESERDVRMMKKSLKKDYCKWLWLFSF